MRIQIGRALARIRAFPYGRRRWILAAALILGVLAVRQAPHRDAPAAHSSYAAAIRSSVTSRRML